MIRGIPISPGIGVARAMRIDPHLARKNPDIIDSAALSAEVRRFDAACDVVNTELTATIERVRKDIGENEAAIFQAHRLLLNDPALVSKVKGIIIRDQVNAIAALDRTLEEYRTLFSAIPDDYLRERLADINDVIDQIISHLTYKENEDYMASGEPVILVAPEIRPSQTVMFDRFPIAGIITETGGTTSHAAVLARGHGIPAVTGLTNIMKQISSGDLVIVDGREGIVMINPGAEIETAYRKIQREFVSLRHALAENRDLPSVTRDGEHVELLANVNVVSDAVAALAAGAEGVGLFRTEYVFLSQQAAPSEDEQVARYSQIIDASPQKRIIVRTLDLGGDKQVTYLPHHMESNPFLGYRSIRMASEHPEFFEMQIRAVLRAATRGHVSLMFPMISTIEEVRKLKRLVDSARMSLYREKKPFGSNLPLGVMIEVPAAVMCIDHILKEVDFVSIGSNDLIQYTMAADRDNPKVAHLCDPCHPASLRVIHRVIRAAIQANKPVTVCGEMAGRPGYVLPLLGMGLRRFSMGPAFIQVIKEVVRSVTTVDARRIAQKALRLQTADEVRTYLKRALHRLSPEVADLETF
ncbi:MAG: phosphoenolpyruvate--protein phosphotransferase [Zavarzinella sp.]